MNAGKRLKTLRIEKGITQREIADKLGVTTQRICAIESGRHDVGVELYNSILSLLGYKLNFVKK